MITSIAQFVLKAHELNEKGRIYDIYGVFEDDTIDSVRDQVYSLATDTTPEPFRCAMINMGFKSF